MQISEQQRYQCRIPQTILGTYEGKQTLIRTKREGKNDEDVNVDLFQFK